MIFHAIFSSLKRHLMISSFTPFKQIDRLKTVSSFNIHMNAIKVYTYRYIQRAYRVDFAQINNELKEQRKNRVAAFSFQFSQERK